MGRKTFIIVMLTLFLMGMSSAVSRGSWVENGENKSDVGAYSFGPRLDSVIIKLEADFNALENNEVDVMDWPLSDDWIDKWSEPPYNETIALEEYVTTGMYILDINNNETINTYKNWRSPTSYTEFRRAIAHLVDRPRIIEEILNGYGLALTTPVMPWLEKWFNPSANSYPFDPVEATQILDAAGFVQGSTQNPYYNASRPGSSQYMRVYPAGHEKAEQDIDELIFYVRYDHAERNATAALIIDELRSVGVPVRIPGPISIQELVNKIWQYGDYHLYTGGWFLGVDPTYLYWLYHSSNYFDGYLGYPNYNNVHDGELDYWLEKLYEASSQEEAIEACRQVQRRFSEIVASVPLWCPLELKAYRRGWADVVNEENFGVDSWWTFLNAHPPDFEQGGTMRYGLTNDIEKLNPIYSGWYADWLVLDKIYDTLIRYEPYNITEEVPWLASSWTVETVNETRTKITFHLRDEIYWHDGLKFTSEDVKFTIEYIKSSPDPQSTAFYYNVASVLNVDAPDPQTVIVYLDVQGIWTLHDLAELPIIPKHIWENIPYENATGFAPDPNLIGTGPFKFAEYVAEDHVLLNANDNYFRKFAIQLQVDAEPLPMLHSSGIFYNMTVKNCLAEKGVNVTVNIYLNRRLETRLVTVDASGTVKLDMLVAVGLLGTKVKYGIKYVPNATCSYTVDILLHSYSAVVV